MRKPLDAAMTALQEAGREIATLRAEVEKLRTQPPQPYARLLEQEGAF